jgi:hypothetical protein
MFRFTGLNQEFHPVSRSIRRFQHVSHFGNEWWFGFGKGGGPIIRANGCARTDQLSSQDPACLILGKPLAEFDRLQRGKPIFNP